MRTEKFEVVFGDLKTQPKKNQVVLVTTLSTWNDFGFYPSMAIYYLNESNDVKSRGAMFGHMNHKYGKQFHELAEEFNARKESPSSDIEYFTMLAEMKDYRGLVDDLGSDSAKALLSSINDVVVAKESNPEWLGKALITEVFRRAFMRNSEQFFTYHNALPILSGLNNENLKAISSSLNLEFRLNNFRSSHLIPLRFDSDRVIPKRINVLIGKNGLGKSQALYRFSEALLQINGDDTELRVNEPGLTRPMVNRLIVIGTPGETGEGFPKVDLDEQKIYYRYLELNSEVPDVGSLGEELVKLARNIETIGDKSRWAIFIEAISQILPIKRLYIKLKNGKEVAISDLYGGYSEQDQLDQWSTASVATEVFIRDEFETEFYPLSSGQLTFFKFTLLMANFIENGSYVLIDEPETHLHPQFVSQFIDLLDTFLKNSGSFAIIATHSPYVVREVTRDQVHLFREDGAASVNVTNPRLRTFGADIESISQFVFDEDSSSRLTDKVYKSVKNMEFSEVEEYLGDEISISALMDIKRRMEDA